MKYTPNLNLKKPDREDFYNVEDFNENADIIDEAFENVRIGYEVIGTLVAGSESITLTHPKLTADSTIDFYTTVFGVAPTNAVASAGQIEIEFPKQDEDIQVKVVFN